MTESEAIKALEQGDKNSYEAEVSYEEYLEAIEMGRKALEEIQQYRAIGTVEECRIAVEKHNKKIKPLKVHNRFACPCCTNSTQEVILTEHTEYCFVCGQGFDWE